MTDTGDASVDGGLRDAEAFDGGVAIIEVLVQLDGQPSPNTLVLQGGSDVTIRTDAQGRASLTIDRTIAGEDVWILASHPEARIWGDMLRDDSPSPFVIDLDRYDRSDNPAYEFQDPGEPRRRPTTAQCAHCHQTINEDWFESQHRRSASNPAVHSLYSGTSSIADAAACASVGGRWQEGRAPGGWNEMRCYTGEGVLDVVNPSCTPPCETPTAMGGCADCHAPGINGQLGGRDLLEAEGLEFEYGVHCDVCHRVDEVRLNEPPGAAGRLLLRRPVELASPALGAGGRLPLTFGPSHDAPNPRMGSVQRDHYHRATICAGCHQYDQPVLVPGAAIDMQRWPSGRLPIHSTYEEWQAGPYNPSTVCQDCHMPPDATVRNGGDLQRFPWAELGFQGGFERAPGAVRRHSFLGPRSEGAGLLELAAGLFVDKQVQNGRLTASITVRNLGCGHAMPTGEPMRSVVLLVEASCGATPLAAAGGDVVPDFGGYVSRKPRGEDWGVWRQARQGDRLYVVRRPGGHHDYQGFGPFGGRFTAAEKGLPVETFASMSTVTSISGARVGLDQPMAAGDFAYLVRGTAHAGKPGFAFARVLVAQDGRRHVPHYLATDIASDNRLMPLARWTSTHEFIATCAEPVVRARLVHQAYATQVGQRRSWNPAESMMTEVRR